MTLNEHKNAMVDLVNQKTERLQTALKIATDDATKRAFQISADDRLEVFLSSRQFPNSEVIQQIFFRDPLILPSLMKMLSTLSTKHSSKAQAELLLNEQRQ